MLVKNLKMGARQPVIASPSVFYTYQHPFAQYHDPAVQTLAYRPLHVPLPNQFSTAAAEQQTHHQQQLSLAVAASSFQQQQHAQPVPTFHHHQQIQHQIPIRTSREAKRARPTSAMASYGGMSEEDLAELQKVSNEFEPDVTVCLLITFATLYLSDVKSLFCRLGLEFRHGSDG